MAVTLGVVRETAPNERRVAMTPEVAKKLKAGGVEVLVAAGAGERAGIEDAALAPFVAIAPDNDAVLARADLVFAVQPPSVEAITRLREGATWIGLLAPHADPERVKALRDRRITAFAMELLPRTTRAQAMDVLSSQAAMAGYKAVLIAAEASPKFFPMLTTAAGTIRPAKVLVIGAGVAGLQAIATARRLGAQVEGFDVRPEVREQIQSLGAKFLDLGVSASGAGGYARELTPEERAEQQRRLAEHVKGVRARATGAEDHHPRDGRGHAPRRGDRRPRRGDRRQLRSDPGRRDRRGGWGRRDRTRQPAEPGRAACERDVREEPPQLRRAAAEGRRDRAGLRRRPRRRHLPDPRRHDPARTDPPAHRRRRFLMDGLTALYVFMLAAFTGHVIISRVPVILHTPLMSGSNFVHGIVVVGGMVALAHADTTLERAVGFLAVLLGAGNAVGGYVVTERMLEMFKSSKQGGG
jgi:NAD(P) transhydrogenase subunit alpha